MNPVPDRTVDARGELCPVPITELARHTRELPLGAVVAVLSDDAAFPLDLRAWCASHGQELVELRTEGAVHRASVRKVRG